MNEDKAIMFIESRIEDLLDEADKAAFPEDSQWLRRIAQELEWAKQVMVGEYTLDCVLEIDDDSGTYN